jgi:dihydroorotate dehydrogenase
MVERQRALQSMIFKTILRPLLFNCDAETAHRFTINALAFAPVLSAPVFDPVLGITVAGLDFASPVGLAAGFDKDAEVWREMLGLGFGFVEVGSITPRPQGGNPKPRLFRLIEDEGVINRMGFNNRGHDAAVLRLSGRLTGRKTGSRTGIVGVNLGANKDSDDRIADYTSGVRLFAPLADYLAINISSPNTPGLRGLQQGDALIDLLDAVADARGPSGPPMFLKIAPDLSRAELDDVAKAVAGRIDALIMGNTTLSRDGLTSQHRDEGGGLSGKPLAAIARRSLIDLRRATGGSIPIVAAGGIDSAEEAYARIRVGASLVQIYSAMVYHGPGLARSIADGLAALLKRDGFAALSDAVGIDD